MINEGRTIQFSRASIISSPQCENPCGFRQRRISNVVLQELAEVSLVAILADHEEWVAVGDANANYAHEVRVIETGQDFRLLDEISPEK